MRRSPLRLIVAVAGACSLAAAAFAQVDPTSPWPQFKANAQRRGAVLGVPAPAVVPGWRLSSIGTTSAGGLTLGSNGSIYFKSNDSTDVYVYRISAATGAIQAQSVNFGLVGGANGNHSGVAVGVDEVYTTIWNDAATPANDTRILVLDKTTLAVLRTYTHANFVSLRGTPLISTITDVNGHYTLYCADRNGKKIHAVDATDGTVRWSYTYTGTEVLFDQPGPLWVDGTTGKQRLALFRRDGAFAGMALEDNGDSTAPTLLWEGGPDSFNWWGSGALSADGTAAYVTTFNDGNVPSLWKISLADGAIVWSVPGNRGDPTMERNYFARPSVIGNRIYIGGAYGLVSCIVDDGASYTVAWDQRDYRGELTGFAAVRNAGGEVYVYAVSQEVYLGIPPAQTAAGYAEVRVLKDLGNSYCEVYRTSLNETMKFSFNAANTPVVDASGNMYFAGGRGPNATAGEIYQFGLGALTGACCFDDGSCQVTDCETCSGLGGTFLGAGTTCSPNPCPQPGACCTGETCAVMQAADCTTAGGEFRGENTNCSPNPCISGACCLDDGSCIETFQSDCLAQSGAYQGDNTFCVSYAATRGAVAIEDIHLTGTHLAAGEPGEDASTTIPIGFTFNFHNNDYTQLRINDNGYISFSGADGPASWVPAFGAVEPNDLIAVAWTDLSSRLPLASAEPNGVFYENRTSPNRLIVQWHRVSTYTGNPTAIDESTFQAILYEGSNDIEIRWGDLDIFLVDDIAQVGLENSDGSRTQTVVNASSGESETFAYTSSCAAACPGVRGDVNCSGGPPDFFDIDPFLLALFDPTTYLATYCGGSICAADIDCSNAVDFFDIDPFLECLFATCPACP